MTEQDLMSWLALGGFVVVVVAFILALITPRLPKRRADTVMGAAVLLFGFGAFVFLVSYVTLFA